MGQPGIVFRGPWHLEAGRRAGLGERPVAVVVVEGVRQPVESLGGANVGQGLVPVVLARWVVLPGPVDVMANVEVREAVAVEIAPGGTRAPERVGQTRRAGHVREAPAPVA